MMDCRAYSCQVSVKLVSRSYLLCFSFDMYSTESIYAVEREHKSLAVVHCWRSDTLQVQYSLFFLLHGFV